MRYKESPETIKPYVANVNRKVLREVMKYYKKRLVSFALFGSFARGTYRHDSDLDILIIAEGLPHGRMKRMAEFTKVEKGLEKTLRDLHKRGIFLDLSPVIKSPQEALSGSPLFLDMVDDAVILYDREDFLKKILKRLKERLSYYGAKRIWKGNAWYWDLKPDFRPGDIIEI